MNKMTKSERAWLAGILEGEGCFSICHRETSLGKKYSSFAIKLSMTDKDVVEKVFQLVGVGKFRPSIPRKPDHYKPISIWSVNGHDGVKRICKSVLPFMGIRRGEKIRYILQGMIESPPRKKWQHGTRWGYDQGCRCDKCKRANADRFMARRRKQGIPKRTPPKHGTRSKYVHGCRCEKCRIAARTYERNLYRSRRPNSI